MANKGVIYVMKTAIDGVVKIGKSETRNYNNRMRYLETNGYRRIGVLNRAFAIEVDDYSTKEIMLHNLFENSRLADTELFALNLNSVISLLASFEGRQIYPEPSIESKAHIFESASEISESTCIPDGIYCLTRKIKKGNVQVNAKARVVNGIWTLLKDSTLAPLEGNGISKGTKEFRKGMPVENRTGKLREDVSLGECTPSYAADIVIYASCNGWVEWKDKQNRPISIYRPGPNGENSETD